MSESLQPPTKKSKKKVNIWTKDLVTELLELFEQYPCMYDTKNAFYANKHARSDALTKIANQLTVDISTEEVKTKINNIRSQMSHEIKKIQVSHSGDGADEVHEPVWWFTRAEFLLPHIKARKGRETLEVTEGTQNDDTTFYTEYEEFSQMDDSDASILSPIQVNNPTETPKPTKNNATEENCQQKTLVETLKILNENISKPDTSLREAEFGIYIAKELSKIQDMDLLCDAKHEINNIVYKYLKQDLKNNITVYEVDN